jgi:UDP-N-acetylmuramoylalanine--D-glutamate ligase
MTRSTFPAGARYWFEGRRACVIGLGKSGVAAARLLDRLGARVSVTERRPASAVAAWRRMLPRGVACETGGHRLLAESWDLIVTSPGVPSRLWEPSARRGVPVWGELELGYRVLRLADRWPRRSAAVTGTNGKTTTTALLGEMFRRAGWPTIVAGNIGTPLCDVVERVNAETALALEVSSYQLEGTHAFAPAVGAVLNLTPDHLGRHGTMAEYARTKFRLFASHRRGRGAVLNAADGWCRRLAASVTGDVAWFGSTPRSCPGVYREGAFLTSRLSNDVVRWSLPRFLPGEHNVENALAAAACARWVGVPSRAVATALREFRGVEHRLEVVRERNGVRFINDSKATNVDSTRVALRSFTGGLIVILGGEDKGAPYTPLREYLRERARRILLIGESAPKIERDLRGAAPLTNCGTLELLLSLVTWHRYIMLWGNSRKRNFSTSKHYPFGATYYHQTISILPPV